MWLSVINIVISIIIKSQELSCVSVYVGKDVGKVKYQVSFSISFLFFSWL